MIPIEGDPTLLRSADGLVASIAPNAPRPSAHPVVLDAYERGFRDGVEETITQLRERYDLDAIPGLKDWLKSVEAKMIEGEE